MKPPLGKGLPLKTPMLGLGEALGGLRYESKGGMGIPGIIYYDGYYGTYIC